MNLNENEKQNLLHKELDFIQACINRMAQSSFNIKGWYFALIIVISAWKFGNSIFYSWTLIIATIIFYILNLQFYIYERRYRVLYSNRIKLRCEDKDYTNQLYSLTPEKDPKSLKFYTKNYVWKNKMLLFMYFGICILLVAVNFLG